VVPQESSIALAPPQANVPPVSGSPEEQVSYTPDEQSPSAERADQPDATQRAVLLEEQAQELNKAIAVLRAQSDAAEQARRDAENRLSKEVKAKEQMAARLSTLSKDSRETRQLVSDLHRERDISVLLNSTNVGELKARLDAAQVAHAAELAEQKAALEKETAANMKEMVAAMLKDAMAQHGIPALAPGQQECSTAPAHREASITAALHPPPSVVAAAAPTPVSGAPVSGTSRQRPAFGQGTGLLLKPPVPSYAKPAAPQPTGDAQDLPRAEATLHAARQQRADAISLQAAKKTAMVNAVDTAEGPSTVKELAAANDALLAADVAVAKAEKLLREEQAKWQVVASNKPTPAQAAKLKSGAPRPSPPGSTAPPSKKASLDTRQMAEMLTQLASQLQVCNPNLHLPAFDPACIDMDAYMSIVHKYENHEPHPDWPPSRGALYSYLEHVLRLYGPATYVYVSQLLCAYANPCIHKHKVNLNPKPLTLNPTPSTLDPARVDVNCLVASTPHPSPMHDVCIAPLHVPLRDKVPAVLAVPEFSFPVPPAVSAVVPKRLPPSSAVLAQGSAQEVSPAPNMDAFLAVTAINPNAVHELPLPPQLEQMYQLKEALQKGGKKRNRRSPPPSSSDSDDSSEDVKGKETPRRRDNTPDTSSSGSDSTNSDASNHTKNKAHKRTSKDKGHIVKYGLPPMAMFDGSLKPGEGDDKIPCLHHWFKELETRAKRLEMPIIELLSIQTIAAAKRWTINELKKEVHTKLYKHKRRKASDKDIKKEFFNINLRHLKFKKIRDMSKLLKGSVKQLPNEQVSQYVLRFRTQLGEADFGGYAQDSRLSSMLCFYFREGLLPHLRKYAHSDDKAQPFVNLDSLINHIYGKEDEVLDMQSSVDTTGRLAAYTDPRHPHMCPQGSAPPAPGRHRGQSRGQGQGGYGRGGRGGYQGGHQGGYQGGYHGRYQGRGNPSPMPPYMMQGPPPMGQGTHQQGGQGRGSKAPPPGSWAAPQHRQPRTEGSLRSNAIAVMREVYPSRHSGYNWDDQTLGSYYNHYNKSRMCAICEVEGHVTKECNLLNPEEGHDQQYDQEAADREDYHDRHGCYPEEDVEPEDDD
jgi:hypothetical protein